jgi:hypothetical protein
MPYFPKIETGVLIIEQIIKTKSLIETMETEEVQILIVPEVRVGIEMKTLILVNVTKDRKAPISIEILVFVILLVKGIPRMRILILTVERILKE